jgi:hypothetical protein
MAESTLVRVRARGLAGYDVALTRRRSPVLIRPGPSNQTFFLSDLLADAAAGTFTALPDKPRTG